MFGLRFCGIAGALAGFLFAIEVSLLRPIIWVIGYVGEMSTDGLLQVWLQDNPMIRFSAAGLTCGVACSFLLPRMGATAVKFAHQTLFGTWALLSFAWVVGGPVPVELRWPAGLFETLIALVLSLAAYHLWCALVRSMIAGHVWRIVWTVAAMGLMLWVPFVAHLVLS
jgi:hypothetical protein